MKPSSTRSCWLGGLTRKADERNIILSRPTAVCDCRVVLPICHEEIVAVGRHLDELSTAAGRSHLRPDAVAVRIAFSDARARSARRAAAFRRPVRFRKRIAGLVAARPIPMAPRKKHVLSVQLPSTETRSNGAVGSNPAAAVAGAATARRTSVAVASNAAGNAARSDGAAGRSDSRRRAGIQSRATRRCRNDRRRRSVRWIRRSRRCRRRAPCR